MHLWFYSINNVECLNTKMAEVCPRAPMPPVLNESNKSTQKMVPSRGMFITLLKFTHILFYRKIR